MVLLMLCMGLTSCDDILGQFDNPFGPLSISVNSIDLDADEMTLTVGDVGQLIATVGPENATDKTVTWTSSKESVATVDATGKVTAVAEGIATITAKAGGKTAECTVTVAADPLATPLTVEAITAGTITVNSPKAGMQYSLNGGAKTAVSGDISVSAGDKVAFYGNGTSITSYNGTRIVGGTADIKVYGNIMSLVDETGFATNTELTAANTFRNLFRDNTKLTDASGLLLPAKKLADNCYAAMFRNCTSLTTAPKELPAETLAQLCYYDMFNYCIALTETPKLPAKNLADNCYMTMFRNCTSLTTAYVKAAYDSYCYYMFDGCTAAGVLHTTTANKDSWESAISSEGWSTWTAAGDWND